MSSTVLTSATDHRDAVAGGDLRSSGLSEVHGVGLHSNNTLEVKDLCVRYGLVVALEDISLSLASGQIVSVIGPNGAGKSTLLNALMGVLRPVKGTIVWSAEDLTRLSVEARVCKGLSLVPEKRELFTSMSVSDNLRLGGYTQLHRGRANVDQGLQDMFRLFPRLKERGFQLAATLSGGERQMLAIARALMARPKLLMLDEPSLGLAPRITREVFKIIQSLKESGVSILLVEQNARAALQVSDYAYLLENGRICLQGASSDLMHDPKIVNSYLGLPREG